MIDHARTRAVGCSALFGDSAVVNPPQPELSPLGPVLELAVGLADQLDSPWRYPSTSMPWIARNEARYWRCTFTSFSRII